MTKLPPVLIIGAGPAGYTAAIYAARAGLSPVLIAGLQPGGQLTVTTDVENYPGFATPVQGPWLVQQMYDQALACGAEIVDDLVASCTPTQAGFEVLTDGGDLYLAQAVILATGAQARWLGLRSEQRFIGAGVSACATCDGVFFKNKDVAVVGGGNTAVEEALYLTHHARKVYLVHRRDRLRAEQILQQRLWNNPKIEVLWNQEVVEILGSGTPAAVDGIQLCSPKTHEQRMLPVDGVFVAIGHTPNTSLVQSFVSLDADGYVQTRAGSTRTDCPGLFAAGDVQDKIYRQAVTAAGSGCMAALDAERWLAHAGGPSPAAW